MACRPVEHPRRNFQPTVCLRSVQGAAKNDMVSLVDSPMNANSAIKPRMMPIKNLAKNGPVGVLKPRCITRLARTFQSTRTHRRRERYMPLVAFCLSHFLADFIICMCVFDFRQAQVNPEGGAQGEQTSAIAIRDACCVRHNKPPAAPAPRAGGCFLASNGPMRGNRRRGI